MRYIEFQQIVDAVKSLCIEAACKLGDDILAALEKARDSETEPLAIEMLDMLIKNARIAEQKMIPLCQDTGLAIVFVEQGSDVIVKPLADRPEATIYDAINLGVKLGYEQGYLRKSVVTEPLNRRENTGTNCPAIIHHKIVPGDRLKLSFIAKGGGCENKSRIKFFNPTVDKQTIIDWIVDVVRQAGADACPPFVLGIGIGGDFEQAALLGKKALLRKIGQRSADRFYAELEQQLLERINELGMGPGGFGGRTTALDCFIEYAPCHIASLPVAVNIDCHSHRHKHCLL